MTSVPKNMDSKRIKRLNNGRLTVEPLSSFSKPLDVICDHCAISDKCKFKRYAERHSASLQLRITSCEECIPAIGFSISTGLNLYEWNTIRISEAWSKRLKTGDRVMVVNSNTGESLGIRTVQESHSGKLADMIEEHARFNHAIQGELLLGKIKEDQINERMTRIIRNSYGSNYAPPDRISSVLYLRKSAK